MDKTQIKEELKKKYFNPTSDGGFVEGWEEAINEIYNMLFNEYIDEDEREKYSISCKAVDCEIDDNIDEREYVLGWIPTENEIAKIASSLVLSGDYKFRINYIDEENEIVKKFYVNFYDSEGICTGECFCSNINIGDKFFEILESSKGWNEFMCANFIKNIEDSDVMLADKAYTLAKKTSNAPKSIFIKAFNELDNAIKKLKRN